QRVQSRGGIDLAQKCCGLREQAHAQQPLHVEGQGRAACSRQVVEPALCVCRPPQPSLEVEKGAAKDWTSPMSRDRISQSRLNLVEALPVVVERVKLEDVGGVSETPQRRLTACERLPHELLAVAEPARPE